MGSGADVTSRGPLTTQVARVVGRRRGIQGRPPPFESLNGGIRPTRAPRRTPPPPQSPPPPPPSWPPPLPPPPLPPRPQPRLLPRRLPPLLPAACAAVRAAWPLPPPLDTAPAGQSAAAQCPVRPRSHPLPTHRAPPPLTRPPTSLRPRQGADRAGRMIQTTKCRQMPKREGSITMNMRNKSKIKISNNRSATDEDAGEGEDGDAGEDEDEDEVVGTGAAAVPTLEWAAGCAAWYVGHARAALPAPFEATRPQGGEGGHGMDDASGEHE